MTNGNKTEQDILNAVEQSETELKNLSLASALVQTSITRLRVTLRRLIDVSTSHYVLRS